MPTRWRHAITAYAKDELRALTFPSVEEIDRAIDLCWEDPDLAELPHAIADGQTLIVPREAVAHFGRKGCAFTESELLNRDELTDTERAELQRQYGM